MRVDRFVLVVVCIVAAIAAAVYLVALVAGTVMSYGLLLPALALFVVVLGVLFVVIRQRMRNAEDDHYDNIGR